MTDVLRHSTETAPNARLLTREEWERERIAQLVHAERTTKSGSYVLVLNTGALIKPEGRAMLQALHSRSVGGVKSHLKTLAEKGPEKFIKTYFVGYGHKSIGDMAECIIFAENISMLCAKAIQDNRLYRGQEASTRYIDFAEQPFLDPLKTPLSADIQEHWRRAYVRTRTELIPLLREQFPRKGDEPEKMHQNAIEARAYDISRCLLPAGAATNIAWTGDFRTAADKLCWLRHHPLAEVREVALAIEDALIEMHPSGFSNKRYEESESYYARAMRSYYFSPSRHPDWLCKNSIDTTLLEGNNTFDLLWSRPPKTELPKWIEEAGTVRFDFLLDFGSFRDVQRHRAIVQRMPLLTTRFGFEEWYLRQMPGMTCVNALSDIDEGQFMLEELNTTPEIAQYYIPMGYRVPNRIVGSLPALVYLVELRANRFTHPTLREKAQSMAEHLAHTFRTHGLQIHLDPDPDRFDIRRGEQTIVDKEVL